MSEFTTDDVECVLDLAAIEAEDPCEDPTLLALARLAAELGLEVA